MVCNIEDENIKSWCFTHTLMHVYILSVKSLHVLTVPVWVSGVLPQSNNVSG